MAEKLRIGEVAALFEVTTKTIRHYEEVGLLQPERAENGYRQYGPEEVLCLQRIRRLQGLGLSLKQIGRLLQEDDAWLWASVLRTLHEEVAAEIELLQARQEQIERLLDGELLHAVGAPLAPPDKVSEYLAQHLPQAHVALWQREETAYAFLGDLLAGAGHALRWLTMPAAPPPGFRRNGHGMAQPLAIPSAYDEEAI